ALPVFHHRMALDETVHQVRPVLVQFAFDVELDQVANQRSVDGSLFAPSAPEVRGGLLVDLEQSFIQKFTGSLGNRTVGGEDQLVDVLAIFIAENVAMVLVNVDGQLDSQNGHFRLFVQGHRNNPVLELVGE